MKLRMRGWIGGCVIAFVLVMATSASAFELGARGWVWFPELKNLDIQATTSGDEGTKIDTKDVLDIGNEATYSVEAFGGVGRHHLSLMFTPFDYQESQILASNLKFKGATFLKGTAVESEMSYSMFDLKYQYDFIDMENILAGFSLGGIAQVKYSTGSFKLNATGTGFDRTESFDSWIPMLGLGVHVGLLADLLELRAQATGGAYDSENYAYEALADLSLTPFPFLDIHAGYKLVQLKVDQNNYMMDVFYTGPYAGLTLGF